MSASTSDQTVGLPITSATVSPLLTVNPLAAGDSQAQSFTNIFRTALKEYEKLTGKELYGSDHPYATQLRNCQSPEDILQILLGQTTLFEEHFNCSALEDWLTPIVNILFTFLLALGEGIALVVILLHRHVV